MTDDHPVPNGSEQELPGEPYFGSSGQTATGSRRNTGIRHRGIAFIIVVATASGHLAGLQWAGDHLSRRSLGTVIPWTFGCLLMLLWWTFLSGVCWKTRFRGLGIVAFGALLFVGVFRWEGQSGNFVPHFGLRFFPTAEEHAVQYFKSESGESASFTVSERLEITSDDWPGFGGIRQDQIVRNVTIRRDWDEKPPAVLWRHPVGPGWSSFAIVGQRAFTQEQRGEDEAVVCYDAATGKQIWLHTDRARFSDAASGAGPRATPTIHSSRLYALGATGILNCLDPVTGDCHWTRNIIEDAGTRLIEWGMAGSPLIYEDVVIVNPGGKTAAVIAYDCLTGEQRWSGAGDRATYASPQIAELDGVPQVLIYCSTGLWAHAADSGKKLWSFPWTNMTRLNIAQPIVLPDKSVFISSGYGGGSALLSVTRSGDNWQVEPQWTRPDRFQLKFNGGIYRDGYVYGLDDGILSCFDLSIGQKTWKRGRYRFGQIVMVGDDLLVLTESGRVVLVEVTPETMTEVSAFQAIEGKTWNHPVVNRGRLYVRNGQEAACYDLSLQVKPAQETGLH
ncbi:MAG: PQQ-like beta-propeller repeat protein [Fuerstiella sp.]|nr:PQQ-like beta-propeller repeat protein [Fuerstiella sp.]